MLARAVLTLMSGHHEGLPAYESLTPTMTHIDSARAKTIIKTTADQARSEPCRLAIDPPDLAQRIADLAEGGLGPNGIEHGRDHVLRRRRNLDQTGDRCTDGGLVTGGPPGGQRAHLLHLHLVADAQDLQLVADRLGVAVDTDHLLLALLQSDLVGECRVRDLGHEPAVLDSSQDPRCHRADGVNDLAVRAQ